MTHHYTSQHSTSAQGGAEAVEEGGREFHLPITRRQRGDRRAEKRACSPLSLTSSSLHSTHSYKRAPATREAEGGGNIPKKTLPKNRLKLERRCYSLLLLIMTILRCKVAIVGDCKVGKTSLTAAFHKGKQYNKNYVMVREEEEGGRRRREMHWG